MDKAEAVYLTCERDISPLRARFCPQVIVPVGVLERLSLRAQISLTNQIPNVSLDNKFAGGSEKKTGAFVYLCHVDPSGDSSLKDPDCPLCVVSCVIVTEEQWRSLKELCSIKVDKLVPERYREGFEFHAKDLFPRDAGKYKEWVYQDRRGVMQAALDIVADLQFPIRYCLIDKAAHKIKYKDSAYDPLEWAFTVCMEQVEKWFLENKPEEMGLVTIDRPANRKAERRLHTIYDDYLANKFRHSEIKAEHLWDALAVADSRNSRGVQMSDLCSYVINRHCRKRNDIAGMYKTISKQCLGRKLPKGACGPFSKY